MSESKLTRRIRKAVNEGRKALIPYLPFGYPERQRFWDELEALDKGGADIIEIGVPFSDPVADGPVIEQASITCLEQGVCLREIIKELAGVRGRFQAELVLMGYMNPFMQYGLERLAADCGSAGVSGLIVPDLPYEEGGEMRAILGDEGVDLIPLVGLNTSEERLKLYAKTYTGFAYFVSVLGTTGDRETLPEEILEKLRTAREIFSIPMALGFGLKSPEQLERYGDLVDAAVFGSALVRHIKDGGSAAEFMARWK